MRTVKTGISHTDALEMIESCEYELDLRILLHRIDGCVLCFSDDQEEELHDAVSAQFLLIQARKLLMIQ
jgi:hypothetical protein